MCHNTPYRCCRIYGQEPVKTQVAEISKGADLIIATPGRLWDFVSSGIVSVASVKCLVLDEADRMLQMQMDGKIREVIQDFGMPSKECRQTMMFSATFPEECQKLAMDFLYEHIFVAVGVVGGAVCTVSHHLEQVASEDKYTKLISLLDDWLEKRGKGERALVFTNSKAQAKGLDEKLYEKNYDTGALHGDLTQLEREENLRKFRAGEIDVMVATDVASRGLDISGVSHVINYDLPFEVDVYVQRIGRTGRMGHRGRSTTFLAVSREGKWSDREDVIKALPSILKEAGRQSDVPEFLVTHVEQLQNGTWGTADAKSAAVAKNDARGWWSDENATQNKGKDAWASWAR